MLRCPRTQQTLRLENPEADAGEIRQGCLVSADGAHRYSIRDGVPRFVPESNYADNFGMQWNHFSCTQLDSHSGHPISAKRFWAATGWRADDMRGRWVLDVGCGSGRFAEVALSGGAQVIALDYSSAVDACYRNLGGYPNIHVVQGDIYALPLAPASFSFVYSLGVLQHTPDVAGAFKALPPMLSDAGRLCVDFYWKRLRTMLHTKYVLRPVTTRMSQQRLFQLLVETVPTMLAVSQACGRVPLLGRFLQRMVPVADYTNRYPLNEQQLREWAVLDTFDWLAPRYDNPQTAPTVTAWLRDAGLVDVEVFHEGHLVARGHK
jgi:SAM-dependent methyltransferase